MSALGTLVTPPNSYTAVCGSLPPKIAPISTALGVLGMPGLTAWVGLNDIARAQPGETIVVSAATGAVGSLVGQLAKRKGLRVIDSAGREVAPSSVDWSRFTSGNIPYTLRQDPGPKNALGRVKFMFPNPHAVYLHDTPSQSAFELDTRTTSSGCVRVEKPFELAERLLNDPVKWSRAKIDAAVDSGTLQNVTLARPMPVLLAYWTAWVDDGGALNFRSDVYGRDAKWSKGLDAPFSFRREPLN